jgi:hypothetical protein
MSCQFLPPGVNFTNILQEAFSYKSFLHSFYVLTYWACNFWQKNFGEKAAHKMLVKLTPGANVIKQYCGKLPR